MFLRVENYALLRLHKNYNISSTVDIIKKLTQQFVDSFKLIERVDRLVYVLNLSEQ